MLKSSDIPTLLNSHLQSRSCSTIPQPCLPVVLTPPENHQQSRPKIYLTLWKSTYQMTEDPTKPINCCTPPDRWTFRMEEPMDRAISETCNRGQPKNWPDWLSIATAVHNNQKNVTTSLSPNQILLGIEHTLHPSEHHKTNNEAVERRVERMEEAWRQATRAINKKAMEVPPA